MHVRVRVVFYTFFCVFLLSLQNLKLRTNVAAFISICKYSSCFGRLIVAEEQFLRVD